MGTHNRIDQGDGTEEQTVMGVISRESPCSLFVIADISTDGQWLSIVHSEAPRLSEWR